MQFLSKYSVMELFRENAFNIKFYRYHDTFMILYTRLILLAHTISFISYKHVLIAISLYACTMLIQTEENYNNNYKHSLRYSLVIVDRISIFRKLLYFPDTKSIFSKFRENWLPGFETKTFPFSRGSSMNK